MLIRATSFIMPSIMTHTTEPSAFRFRWRGCCWHLTLWMRRSWSFRVWSTPVTSSWLWQRTDGILVFIWTKGPYRFVKVPLSFYAQAVSWNDVRQSIRVHIPWLINSTSGVSFCSFSNTVPGEEETRKWWYFFMPLILFIRGAKKSVQSNVVTMVLPSSRETSYV